MIDLCQWRVTIGLWNCCQVLSKLKVPTCVPVQRSNNWNELRLTLSLVVFFSLIIILSGDVELNPGPPKYKVEVNNVIKVVMDVLKRNCKLLSTVTENCLPQVARKLYMNNLVSKKVELSPTIESVISDFAFTIQCSKSIEQVEEYCHLFVISLSIIEGNAAGISLVEQWKHKLHRDLEISFLSQVTNSEENQTEIMPTDLRKSTDLPDKDQLTSKPEMAQLMEWLGSLVDWESFGLYLPAMTDDTISKIEKDKKTVSEKKRALYSKWLRVCPTATWSDVITALEKMNENYLAEKIKQKLKASQVPEKIAVPKLELQYLTLPSKHSEKIEETLSSLHEKFLELRMKFIRELKTMISSDQQKWLELIDYVQYYTKSSEDLKSCQSLNELMRKIDNSYDFLDCKTIVDIARQFITSSDLSQQLQDHLKTAKQFRCSQPIKKLLKELGDIYDPFMNNPNNAPKAVIYLNNPWSDITIDGLYILIKHFFPKDRRESLLRHIYIRSGSVHIEYYLTGSSFEILLFIIRAAKRTLLMRSIGIYRFEINGVTILQQPEYEHFTFQESLLAAALIGYNEAVKFLVDLNIYNERALLLATAANHEAVVQTLILAGANVNIQNNDGMTALMIASKNDHLQVVELLLSKQADVNIQSNDGTTALMIASKNGHLQVVELLLSKQADVNIQSNDGWTALMEASQNGHSQVAELLLSKQVDVNIQNNDGVTALMIASYNGNSQVVKLLLSKQADVNVQSNDGWTALMIVSQNGHSQVAEILLSKQTDVNIQNNDGFTALMIASYNGNSQVAELLLSKPVDISIQNNDGFTAFMVASQNGHSQVVELLLSKQADVNVQSNDGWTALLVASKNGHSQVVELLLSKQADVNIQNKDGWTALMVASCNGNSQVAELLLSKQADVNIQNNNGRTALMVANQSGHSQVVELLLSKQADVNVQSNGWTALMIASQNGHSQVVELLLSKQADVNIQNNDGVPALMLASYNGNLQVVELLLSKQADVNIQNNDGVTALLVASQNGHSQVAELLLSKQADVNIQNNNGQTALMMASQDGYSQIAEFLLLNKADVNIQNNDGQTALMMASHNGYSQIAEFLLLNKADVNIQNNDGFTALMIGCIRGHSQVVQLLLSKQADIDITINDRLKALISSCILSSSNYLPESYDKFIKPRHSEYMKILELLLDATTSAMDIKVFLLVFAAHSNNIDAVNILLKKVEFSTDHIVRALVAACYGGHPTVFNSLLHKIPDLLQKELLVSCVEGDLAVISAIVESELNPDTPLLFGFTPLMIATSFGHIELIDALIQTGADVNKCNQYGNSVLDIAESTFNKQEIIQLLEEHGATRVNPVDLSSALLNLLVECSNMTYDQPEVTVNTTQDIQSLIKSVFEKIKKMIKEPFHTFKQKPLMETTNKELTYTCTIAS